jgi:hypothetical protein
MYPETIYEARETGRNQIEESDIGEIVEIQMLVFVVNKIAA